MDCWSGAGREVGEKLVNAGEQGAIVEEFVLGTYFGRPLVICGR